MEHQVLLELAEHLALLVLQELAELPDHQVQVEHQETDSIIEANTILNTVII